MGTAANGGKGFKERTRISGERPIGAASDSNPPRRHANPHPGLNNVSFPKVPPVPLLSSP